MPLKILKRKLPFVDHSQESRVQCRRSTLPSQSQSQMSEPQQPIVLSDEEEDRNALSSTPPFQSFHHSKRRRTELVPYPNPPPPPPTVLVLDDDDDGPASSRYLVLDESPCTKAPSDFQTQTRVSHSQHKFSGWLFDFCFCFNYGFRNTNCEIAYYLPCSFCSKFTCLCILCYALVV